MARQRFEESTSDQGLRARDGWKRREEAHLRSLIDDNRCITDRFGSQLNLANSSLLLSS